jgi:hypothetical protein
MAESDPVYARNTANSGEADVVITGFVLPGGESMAAALRRTEQERDEALAEVKSGVDLLARIEQAAGLESSDPFASTEEGVRELRAERDLARAELASARQELDAIRRREAGAS